MIVLRSHEVVINGSEDVIRVRQAVRACAVELGFSLVGQTKIVTAASELARNTLVYGLGGTALIEMVRNEQRSGIRIVFTDNGPGIPDIDQAMTDGYSTGGGLGLGLGGAKRLANEFEIISNPDRGTRVIIGRWV
ncbi:anti-sigma regulatory factor [Acidiphilium sp.]|uniref:anti-sigma regulatory factor n=1 Tax=Acidiphilium sp. TaxID=527 RepID=UPI003D017705